MQYNCKVWRKLAIVAGPCVGGYTRDFSFYPSQKKVKGIVSVILSSPFIALYHQVLIRYQCLSLLIKQRFHEYRCESGVAIFAWWVTWKYTYSPFKIYVLNHLSRFLEVVVPYVNSSISRFTILFYLSPKTVRLLNAETKTAVLSFINYLAANFILCIHLINQLIIVLKLGN